MFPPIRLKFFVSTTFSPTHPCATPSTDSYAFSVAFIKANDFDFTHRTLAL